MSELAGHDDLAEFDDLEPDDEADMAGADWDMPEIPDDLEEDPDAGAAATEPQSIEDLAAEIGAVVPADMPDSLKTPATPPPRQEEDPLAVVEEESPELIPPVDAEPMEEPPANDKEKRL